MNTFKQNQWCFVVMIFLIFIAFPPLKAQEIIKYRSQKTAWISIGTGIYSVNGYDHGKTLLAEISYQNNIQLYSIHASTSFCDEGPEGSQLSFLYGIANKEKNWFWALSAGPSIASDESIFELNGIGATISTQSFFRVSHLGIGLFAVANINTEQNSILFVAALQIGKLR